MSNSNVQFRLAHWHKGYAAAVTSPGGRDQEDEPIVFRALLVAAATTGIITGAVTTAPLASASGPYRNCTEAHRDGRYNIPTGDPDYWSGGDRDNDGLACEG